MAVSFSSTGLAAESSGVFPPSPYTSTNSASWSAGELVILDVVGTESTAITAATLGGTGLTQIGSGAVRNVGGSAWSVQSFYFMPGSNGSGVVGITNDAIELRYAVRRYTGHNTTTPIVGGGSTNSATGASGSGTVTVAQDDMGSTSDNMRVAVLGIGRAGPASATSNVGTEAVDYSSTVFFNGLLYVVDAQSNTDFVITPNAAWDNGYALFAYEIAAAAGGGAPHVLSDTPQFRRSRSGRIFVPQEFALSPLAPTGGTTLADAAPSRAKAPRRTPVQTEWTPGTLGFQRPVAADAEPTPRRTRKRSPALDAPALSALAAQAAVSALADAAAPRRARARIAPPSAEPTAPHYPSVLGSATNASTTEETTYTTSLPTVARGDLLIYSVTKDDDAQIDRPTVGWTVLGQEQSNTAIRWYLQYRIADGDEGATVSVDGASEQWCGVVKHVANFDANTSPAFGTNTSVASTTPDPPSLNPADWGFDDTLWMALCSATDSALSAGPSNCVNVTLLQSTGLAAGRVSMGYADLQRATLAFNPTDYTLAGSEPWVAATVGIRPWKYVVQPILRSTSYAPAATATHTMAFTLDAGSNRRLLVFVGMATAAASISSVTYGGVTMSIASDGSTSATRTQNGYLSVCYTLRESQLPANGSNDIVVTLSGSDEIGVTAVVVSGTAQGSTVSNVATSGTNSGSSTTASPTVATANSLVLAAETMNSASTYDSSLTIAGFEAMGRGDAPSSAGGFWLTARAKELTTETGAQSVTVTGTGALTRALVTVVLAPAGTPETLPAALDDAAQVQPRGSRKRAVLEQPTPRATAATLAALPEPQQPARRARRATQQQDEVTPTAFVVTPPGPFLAADEPIAPRRRKPVAPEPDPVTGDVIVPAPLGAVSPDEPEPPRRRKRRRAPVESEVVGARMQGGYGRIRAGKQSARGTVGAGKQRARGPIGGGKQGTD